MFRYIISAIPEKGNNLVIEFTGVLLNADLLVLHFKSNFFEKLGMNDIFLIENNQ